MKYWWIYTLVLLLSTATLFTACGDDDTNNGQNPTSEDYKNLLDNQIKAVIVPALNEYFNDLSTLKTQVANFATLKDEETLASLKTAYQDAYLAYQAAAVHNYFITANQSLVSTTNLYPIDVNLLESLINTESYNFNTSAQLRANGFPAIDYMLYGTGNTFDYLNGDTRRIAFLQALTEAMLDKADTLLRQWTGDFTNDFIENGGTALGSSISVQLNESLVYFEDHVRENKVGIPIGRLGPNDSAIPADATKIEAYYYSQSEGSEDFTLALVRAAVEEMEDLYLGETSAGVNGQGYDDLLIARGQAAIDEDIKAQFADIYNQIDSRSSISGDESLYNSIQGLITLYKSDLFPVLNVQDADGANDGD